MSDPALECSPRSAFLRQTDILVLDGITRSVVAPLASAAAWNLGQWDIMDEYVGAMREDEPEGMHKGFI